MNKLIYATVMLALAAPVLANDTVKLNFVKKLYRNSLDHLYDSDIIEKYGTKELKRLMKAHPNEPCHLSYSVGALQDMDDISNRRFQYSVTKNGNVRASYLLFGKRVTSEYVLSCHGNRCTVHDIYLGGESMKESLRSCAAG